MHLAGAGIGKADVNAVGDKRMDKAFRAVHGCNPNLVCQKSSLTLSRNRRQNSPLKAACSEAVWISASAVV
jgi:hypothetical protein